MIEKLQDKEEPENQDYFEEEPLDSEQDLNEYYQTSEHAEPVYSNQFSQNSEQQEDS